MQIRTQILKLLFLLISIAAISPTFASAKDTRLHAVLRCAEWGSTCDSGSHKLIAGSYFIYSVVNKEDSSALPLVPGWPDGYILEAALDLPKGQPFTSTPGLIQKLNPTRILSQRNKGLDKIRSEHPDAEINVRDLNRKEFSLLAGEDLAGHSLTFRTRFEGMGLSLVSNTSTISFVAPCDRSDAARVVANSIYVNWQEGNGRRIIELADSMLAAGLTDASAWDFAWSLARASHQYDKALLFLERLYQDFGVLTTDLNTSNPPRLNKNGNRSPEYESIYQTRRTQLLQEKAEYESRQQH